MWSKAIDVVHENRIIRLLDSLEHYIDDIMTELYYSFSAALCPADDIYAELETMVDKDALAYLQKKYGTPSINQMKLFKDVADGIESAADEIQDGQISLKKVEYIDEALQEGVSKAEILAMLKRVISTDELKFAEYDWLTFSFR